VSGYVETRVGFWDVEGWLGRHPVYLGTPDDVVALVLEERGIRRESVRFVYPDPAEASLDYVVLYEPEAAARAESRGAKEE